MVNFALSAGSKSRDGLDPKKLDKFIAAADGDHSALPELSGSANNEPRKKRRKKKCAKR